MVKKVAFFFSSKSNERGDQLNKTPQTGSAASEAPPGAERPSVLSIRLFSQCVDVVGIISFSLFNQKNCPIFLINMDKSIGNH